MLEPSQIKSNSISSLLINEFFNFIEIGYLEGVKECLSRTPELLDIINSETHHSALNAATYYGQKPLVEFFLAQGISLDAGIAPNAEAYAEFHQKLDIKALIENARRSRTSFNPTPLDDDEVLQIAMQESFTTSLPPDTIEDPHQKYINLLLDKSINNSEITRLLKLYPHFINETETNKLTGLHVAVLNNNFELIKFLVDRQANLNGQDTYGNTPLHLAALRGNEGAVIYLISNGANPVIKNNDEKTVAEIAHQHEHLMLSQRIRDFTPPSAASRLPTISVIPSIFHNPQKPSGTTQKLFKHDLERQREYLEAILMLKKILKYITGFDDNLDKIGYNKAEIIYEQFPLLYIDLIQNNPNNIETPLLIAKLPLIDCQRRLIIYFTETLMNIIYKYGRQNFEKEPMHNHAKYLINKGLINYVIELKRNPSLMSTDIFREILQEIKQEFPIIIEFFLLNQLKQPINDWMVLYDKLVAEVNKLTLKINKIKLAVINEAVSAELSNSPAEQTSKLSEEEPLAKRLSSYCLLRERLISGDIKLIRPTVENIDEIISLIQDYLVLLNQSEDLKKREEDLEQLAKYFRQDISYIQATTKKNKKIRTIQEEMGLDVRLAASIAPIEKEIERYKILSLEQITSQNEYFETQEELFRELEVELETFHTQRARMNKSLFSTRARVKAETGQVEWFKEELRREEAEFETFDQRIKDKQGKLDKLKKELVELKSRTDSHFEFFRLQHQSIDIEEKIKILAQKNVELETVKAQLRKFQQIRQVVFLATREELQQIDTNLKKERKLLSSSSQNDKNKKRFVKNCTELELKYAELDELVNEYNQLPTFQQKKAELQQQLPNLNLAANIIHVNCQSLKRYQQDYEMRNLKYLLTDFNNQHRLAKTSIEKIGLLTDFCRWWHEGCSERLKHKIQIILPRHTITRIREMRNKIMHCLDWTHGSQFLVNETQAFDDAAVALGIIIKHLLLNSDYFIQQASLYEMSIAQEEQCINLLKTATSQLPEIPPVRRDEAGRELPPSSEHQVDIFINSVNTGKALLQLIATELTKDATKGLDLETISKAFNQQFDLSCITPQDEVLFRLRWKYDGLLQALGETLGNLQQYKEIIPDIEKLSIKLNEQYDRIHNFVPLIKEYRSLRTHTLYQNLELFKYLLSVIRQYELLICDQLDRLFEEVKDGYKNSNNDTMRNLFTNFDILSSSESIITECKFM